MLKQTYKDGLKIKYYPIEKGVLLNYFMTLNIFKYLKGGINENEK